ncbi:FkbM family methyltransferase [Bosea sp. (in: a-proteobacteria)]|uniref:FkbM family methyltransferase n=1 Tax=Bosea sp. (in: a-proteobacteria) TaxID=1871050 RepID=UPI003F6FBDF8
MSRGDADDLTFIQELMSYLRHKIRYAISVISKPKMYMYENIRIPLGSSPALQARRRDFYRGLHERGEMETIRHLIRPDDIVLELGSGLGIVSTFIAQRLSDSRNLHTFEANPELLGPIRSVFEANDVRPNLHNTAVGQEDGYREFFFNVNIMSSSVHRREGAAKPEQVAMASMSRLLREIRPTFVVFDVEGAEAEIFKVKIPPEVRVLCGELHPNIIGDDGVSTVIRAILDSGFDFIADRSCGRMVAFARPNT